MQHHSARVVLGACLIAATAAAQAPASFSSSAPSRGSGLFERAPTSDAFPIRANSLGEGVGSIGEQVAAQQGEVDYSLNGQFRLLHGDFMNRRERYEADIELRVRAMPNQSIRNEPGSFDMLGYDFDATSRAVLFPDGYLTFGAYYTGRRYVTSSAFGTTGNASGLGDETLVGAGIKLGFGVFLDSNWLLEVETHPGVWSDMDDTLTHRDYDAPSFAMVTYRPMDNLFLKFGARYNQVFEDLPWLPLLGLSWEVTPGFRIDVLAPEHAELSWWPSSSLGILFGGDVTGAEYRVHTSEAINQSDDARVQEVVAYLGLLSRMNDNISFLAKAGVVLTGSYDLTTGAAGFNHVEGQLGQSVFAEFSFGFSF